MPDTLDLILWFLGLPVLLGLGMLLVSAVEWAVWHFGALTARCQTRLNGWKVNATGRTLEQQDSQAFLKWLASKAGIDRSNGAVDDQLVQAQQQAGLIRILVEEEVPKAVLRCVDTHRLMAQVAGAYHLSEIAYEPECYQLRAGVIWLLAHAVQYLEAYPLRLDDTRLLHNSIVLRKRALPCCRRCPYIQLPVDQAPRLCPTAELVQVRKANDEAIQ